MPRLAAPAIGCAAGLFALFPAGALAKGTVSLQPAAGPPGTVATLTGAGLPAGRVAIVRASGAALARVRVDRAGAFVATVRLARPGALTTYLAPRLRVTNRFARSAQPRVGEVAAADGGRVRWTAEQVAGRPVRVVGTGFAARRPVGVYLGGERRVVIRATSRGGFVATVAATAARGEVRQGARRLPFAIRILGPAHDGARPPAGGAAGGAGGAPSTPPASTAAAPGELSFPIRAAFYYPWFPEAWKQGSVSPFTHYTPTLGYYDSGATGTIAQHLEQLQYAHVQAAISSWWGQGHKTDQRLPTILQTTRAVGSPVRWAVYYEPEGWGDPSVPQLTSDLAYLRDRYGSDPAYLRIGGRFVVFAYGDANDGCAMADRWRAANAAIGAYLVLKVVPGHRACAAQPDGWHQYAPANRADSQQGEAFAVSPGFWLATESAPRLGRDITCFRRAVRDMVASRAPWQLVTTFDEWGEGTSVEPAQQWSSASGFGDYLDALHDGGAGPAAAAPC